MLDGQLQEANFGDSGSEVGKPKHNNSVRPSRRLHFRSVQWITKDKKQGFLSAHKLAISKDKLEDNKHGFKGFC
ncbi:hypothetical protein U1Q18_022721 [Sarracenia purpurea var. burkii]